jgi:putative transposase
MKLETTKNRVQNMIFSSLDSIFKNQNEFDFDQFAITSLEALMLLERANYLEQNEDFGNGTYLRAFNSLSKNSLKINVPRTRTGNFHPMVLQLINMNKEQINELALLLYKSGLSSRSVENVMRDYFGESVSKSSIVELAESFHELRKLWEDRQLDAYYKVIYCDALYITLKRNNSYTKEAVYVMYGVKDDNTRELLLLEVNPTENATMWSEYCEKLRKRGVNQVDLFVGDGLPGFDTAVANFFPESDFQKCVVHLQRNWLNKVRPRDKSAFGNDIKEVFNNFEEEISMEKVNKKIEKFVTYWKESYNFVEKLQDQEYIHNYLTYTKYPDKIRRMIYTTNSIENLNRQIRRVTKTKVSFEKESKMLDLIFVVIQDFEANNWLKYPVTAFQYWPKNTQ